MDKPLRILILEDNPADAEIIQFELDEAGIVPAAKVVTNEKDYIHELQAFSPDIILSDYDLPRYSGASALAEAKKRCPDVPFILVTGAVSEDRAIEILTGGAKDYVMKNRLSQRLVPAVKRALAEAAGQRAQRQAEQELREAHAELEVNVRERTATLESKIEELNRTQRALRESIESTRKQAEQLRQSEERQRLVLQASSIGTFEVDLLTGEGQWNATEFELLGLKPGDVNANPETFFRFVHPDDVERLQHEWGEATRTGKLDAEFRVIRADGQQRWLAGKGSFIFNGHPDGRDTGTGRKPRRFVGVNFDITERKKAEETLRESEARLGETLRSVADEIWIVDTQGCIVSLSDSVRENLGVSSDKWADIESALDQLEILRPDGTPRPREEAPLSRALRGEVIRNEGEMIRNLATGQLRWREVSGAPVRYEEGRIIGAVVVVRDITEHKRAEEALKESEQRYRSVVENTTAIIMRITRSGVITFANRRALDFFGYSTEELIGKHVVGTVVPPRESSGRDLATMVDRIAADPDAFHANANENICKDGRRVWLEWTNSGIYGPDGTLKEFLSVGIDATDRKRAEEALKESEQRYRTLFDSMIEGFALHEIITDGQGRPVDYRFLDVNPAFETLTGLKRSALLGKCVREVLPGIEAHWIENYGRVALTGEPTRFENYSSVLDRWYEVLAYRPAPGQFAVVFTDVTARKRIKKREQQEYRETEFANRVLRAFVELEGDALFDQALAVVLEETASRHGVFGYIPQPGHLVCPSLSKMLDACEVEGKCIHYPPEKWKGLWARALKEKRSRYINKARPVPSGHPIIHNNLATPILFHGEVIGLLNIANKDGGYTDADRDTLDRIAARIAPVLYAWIQRRLREEEREAAEAALRKAKDELEAFSFSVSHDLRAPLRAIDGYAHMILRKQDGKFDEETKRQFTQIRDGVKAMGRLIEDLLALSRLAREDLNPGILDMRKLIEKTWQELKKANPDRTMTLKMNRSLPPGLGDEGLILQVIVNILTNAVKFTNRREAALIEAGGYDHDHEIIYYVKDNGVGFDMQYHDKLFGVFQRLHSAHEYEGTGIGMALVQRIIHRHGGRVWAEGEVDQGATFYFALPKRHE